MALNETQVSPLTFGDLLDDSSMDLPVTEAKSFEKPDDWDAPESQEERRMIRSLFADRNMKSFRLRDFLDPKIKENLPKHEATLTKYIESYRNKNVDILSDIYILKNMIFTDNDKNILFTCCGVDEDELDKLIKDLEKPPFVQEQKNITPFRVLLMFVIRYYKFNEKKKTQYEMCKLYYEYNLYYSLFSANFRYGVARPATMVYTIDNLQNGMILKKAGSIEVMMQRLANRVFDPKMNSESSKSSNSKYDYDKLWKDGSDWGMEYMINQLKTRLNGQFSSIRKKYMENYKEGNVSLSQGDNRDDEGNVIETDFLSGRITKLVSLNVSKFYSTSLNRGQIVKICKAMKVSPDELILCLENMRQERHIDELTDFYSALFTLFFSRNPNAKDEDIHSKAFALTAEQAYKSGNSKEPNVIRIKELSHQWLKRGSKTYRNTTSSGTINGFRRAIFLYFVFSAMKR